MRLLFGPAHKYRGAAPNLNVSDYKWTWLNWQKSTTKSRHSFLRNVCIDFQQIDPAAPRRRR